MRISSKEELVEFLESIKDRLSSVVNTISCTETKSEVDDIINEIKDTLYWN